MNKKECKTKRTWPNSV